MPQGTTTRPAGAAGGAPGATPTNPQPIAPSSPGGATPPVNVNPAVRNIEKIEK
jgi:hypothetical protein